MSLASGRKGSRSRPVSWSSSHISPPSNAVGDTHISRNKIRDIRILRPIALLQRRRHRTLQTPIPNARIIQRILPRRLLRPIRYPLRMTRLRFPRRSPRTRSPSSIRVPPRRRLPRHIGEVVVLHRTGIGGVVVERESVLTTERPWRSSSTIAQVGIQCFMEVSEATDVCWAAGS